MKKKTLWLKDGIFWRRCVYLNHGSEGKVYRAGLHWAVKVYHSPSPAEIEKVSALILKIKSLPPWDRWYLKRHIALPRAVLYDRTGTPVGFRMRRISSRYRAHDAMFYSGKMTYYTRLCFACQLTKTIAILHRRGILYCDFNPKNLLCNENGDLKLIDADTMDFHYALKHFRGRAYTPQTISAECYRNILKYEKLYDINPRIVFFDEKTDDFSLAYTLFHLLAGGSPYAAISTSSNDYLSEMDRKDRNICPIFKKYRGYEQPRYIVKKKYLGSRLWYQFEHTFADMDHVRAKEYLRALRLRRVLYTFFLFPIRRRDGKAF